MVGQSPASLIQIGLKNSVFVTNYAWNIIMYGSYYYFIQKIFKIISYYQFSIYTKGTILTVTQ